MIRTPGTVAVCGLSCMLHACIASTETPDKPPIVEVFACSDYCPGPREKYLRNVYEGVVDPESCEAIGGKPYSYVGWGTHFVCLAD